MEIKIERDLLSEALASLQSMAERKTTMPILLNVLLEAKGSSLHWVATDLEVGLSGSARVEVLSPGGVTVPSRGLYDVVKSLPNQRVHLKALENQWVEICCAKSRFKLVGMDAKEYPSLPKKEGGAEFKLSGEMLLEMIRQVDFAVSIDETRYNLNGILVEAGEKGERATLKMVATDGHRLSISEKELKKELPLTEGVLFPKKGMAELKRLVEGAGGEVNFWVGKKHAIIEQGSQALWVRLIDGQFPPYVHVVPQNNKRVLSVPRESLVESLKRVSAVTTDRTRGVRFAISPGNLEMTANNPDLGEAKEELAVQYKGATFTVGFNAAYFLEALQVVEDERIVLQLNDDVSPCLLQSELDRGFIHVIMPMRV